MDNTPFSISALAFSASEILFTGNCMAVANLFFIGSVAGVNLILFELDVKYPNTISNKFYLFIPTENVLMSFNAIFAFKNCSMNSSVMGTTA